MSAEDLLPRTFPRDKRHLKNAGQISLVEHQPDGLFAHDFWRAHCPWRDTEEYGCGVNYSASSIDLVEADVVHHLESVHMATPTLPSRIIRLPLLQAMGQVAAVS